MSELDATDTTAPAPAPTAEDTAQTPPAPPPSLSESLRQRLATASTPLTLKELAKGLKRPAKVKAPEFEASLPGYLADDLQSGRVFKYGSGKGGVDRYWSRDEKHAIREAVLTAAATPATVTDLVKKAVATGMKTDKVFAESVVRDLIGEDRLFEHPPKKKAGPPLFGAEKAPPPPPPKNDPEKVQGALLEAAAAPQTLAKLVAAAVASTKADKAFVTAEATKLIEAERLHKQGPTKTAPYGRDKPKPEHPLEVGKGKKDFEKLAKAARTLLEFVKDVPAAELLDRLRTALAAEPPLPKAGKSKDEIKLTDSATTIASHAIPEHKPEQTTAALPERIRAGLKTAYDELCLDPDFEDKLVEIRRLYHETARGLPSLTVEQFHRELEHLQSARAVELQALNEVQQAKEPELAIRRNDRLLYYVIWR